MESDVWAERARERGVTQVQIDGVLLAARRGHVRLVDGGIEVTDEGRAWLVRKEGKLN